MNSSVKVMTGLLVAMVLIVAAVSAFSINSTVEQSTTAATEAPTVYDNTTVSPVIPSETIAPATETVVLTTVTNIPTEVAQTTNTSATAGTTATATTQATQTAETDADIINAAMSAMSALKNYSGNLTATKKQIIDIQLTDCSIPGAKTLINPIISGLAGDSEETYTVSGGTATASDGSKTTLMEAIPPTGAEFKLVAEGLTSVKKTTEGSNTKYTFKLIPESTTYDNSKPTYHAMATDYLNLAAVDISPAEITQADINYTGMTIEITCDSQGRVISFHENMPIEGEGAGKISVFSITAALGGSLDETWTITY